MHPANELAVRLYRIASEDQRIGLFGAAPLMRTLSIVAVRAILEEYDRHFVHWLDRQNHLEKIMLMDQVACEVRGKAEEAQRKHREVADAKPKSRET